eukprot:1330717-Prymnesium_polylepis.1
MRWKRPNCFHTQFPSKREVQSHRELLRLGAKPRARVSARAPAQESRPRISDRPRSLVVLQRCSVGGTGDYLLVLSTTRSWAQPIRYERGDAEQPAGRAASRRRAGHLLAQPARRTFAGFVGPQRPLDREVGGAAARGRRGCRLPRCRMAGHQGAQKGRAGAQGWREVSSEGPLQESRGAR